jgi:hypothetical protein
MNKYLQDSLQQHIQFLPAAGTPPLRIKLLILDRDAHQICWVNRYFQAFRAAFDIGNNLLKSLNIELTNKYAQIVRNSVFKFEKLLPPKNA